jgi:hypothetical protein
LRADAGHRRAAPLRTHVGEPLVEALQAVQGNLVSRRLRAARRSFRAAPGLQAQRLAEREDGAGGSRGVLPAHGLEFARGALQGRTHLLAQRPQLLMLRRVVQEVGVRQADRAELDRVEFYGHAAAHERQLGGAAADVHVQKRRPRRGTPLRGGDADEARLLQPREDFDAQARGALHLVGELAGVLGLAHRGGGDGDDVLGPASFRALPEAADGFGGARNRLRAEVPLL